MGFSEHMPYICSNGVEASYRLAVAEVKDYIAETSALREKYKDSIDIKIGFEIEYYEGFFEKMVKNAIAYGGEYLILGQHFIGEEYPAPEHKHIFGLRNDEQEFIKYADSIISAMKSGVITYVAHPDAYKWSGLKDIYSREMRRICKSSTEIGIPLEINFLGIRDERHYPNEKFWEIAGEEQSPVTFGFDAHDVLNACDRESLEKAQVIVEKYKLNYIGMPKIVDICKTEG